VACHDARNESEARGDDPVTLIKLLQVLERNWSGREDLNLRPPGPELSQYKLQVP
jgi:hypothetical protein